MRFPAERSNVPRMAYGRVDPAKNPLERAGTFPLWGPSTPVLRLAVRSLNRCVAPAARPPKGQKGGMTENETMPVLTEEMKRFVREQRLGFVATVSPDGSPNVSPKGSLTVLDDNNLVFADVESPHTVRNLVANPRTEINVVDPLTRKGFRFRGKATVLHAGETYYNALLMYRHEGADVRRIRAVVLIEVESAAPLVSPVYTLGLAEDEVRALWEEYHMKTRQRTVLDLIPPRDF
jgi:uncharacterized protein